MKHKLWVVLVLLAYLGLGIMALSLKGKYYLNLSPSEPLGIYRISRLVSEVKQGELVILEIPKQAKPYVYGRKWLTPGTKLLKNIGAAPGDKVRISDKKIWINGQCIGPVATEDGDGLPLPKLRGQFRIKNGYFLPIASRLPNSFDGRYFGPVSKKLILGKAQPVILF